MIANGLCRALTARVHSLCSFPVSALQYCESFGYYTTQRSAMSSRRRKAAKCLRPISPPPRTCQGSDDIISADGSPSAGILERPNFGAPGMAPFVLPIICFIRQQTVLRWRDDGNFTSASYIQAAEKRLARHASGPMPATAQGRIDVAYCPENEAISAWLVDRPSVVARILIEGQHSINRRYDDNSIW